MNSYKYLTSSATALLVMVAACDAKHPLSVKDPDVATPSSLTGPGSLQFYRVGTLADFAVAFVGAADQNNGGHEGIVNFGGLFTDELIDIETFPTRTVMNQRNAQAANGSLAGVFQNVGQAHNDARRAIGQFKQFGADSIGYAEMYALDAYLYVLVAEHWCSGEPFSLIDVATGQVANSPFLTTTQMLDTALAEFQQAKVIAAAAAASAGDKAQLTELAQVGAARALLDLGQVTAAADSAALMVDATFGYQIFESTNSLRQSSGIWFYNVNFPSFGEGDLKNGNGLPFATSGDPRTAATLGAAAGGQPTPFYVSNTYGAGGASTPTTLASYNEAQLIVAEGDIQAGNYGAALGIMNALRGGVFHGASDSVLVDLSAASPKAQMQQVLTERAYWMWVTGHRLGDWRRMLRAPYTAAPFNFVISDVYPTGNGLFNILEFPTPQLTNPNPNYKACDPTIP